MFNTHKVEIEWGGRPLILETGKIARQADGAVMATYGETVVLATVVSAKEPRSGQDFFPLTVNYQEKTYAAGKIPGGYFKREGRPSENETLVSRLIDRPIRPLFPEGYKNDTQVILTVMQHDLENNPDVLSMIAASAALTLSGIPFMGPIGGARVGYINGEYVLNPHVDEMIEFDAGPRRRRYSGCGADGRIRGQGASRGCHARRRHVRPQGDPAGHGRHHQARRSGRQGAARLRAGGPFPARGEDAEGRRGRASHRLQDHRQGRALCCRRRRQGKGEGALRSGRGRRCRICGRTDRRGVQASAGKDRPLEHPRHQEPHRRPGSGDRPADRRRGRGPAAHARLGAVHPRRDTGDRGRHARNGRGRAVCRRADRHVQGRLHAALQLPALFGRGDGPHGLAGPPRDRPRQARLAGDPPDAADRGPVPLHVARRLRDHRVRTAPPRWRPCAEPRWRSWMQVCRSASRWPASPWA